MATNPFENSRISEGTRRTGAPHEEGALNESRAVSRDDVRDGFAEAEVSNMIAEGGPPSREGNAGMPQHPGPRRMLAASTMLGDRVRNLAGEDLGKIEELMVDPWSGRIAYAVLSFGGFLGFGDKRFPVPWQALRIDRRNNEILFDVDRKTLEEAPNFDKEKWPDLDNPELGGKIHGHYGRKPYWEHTVTDTADLTGDEPLRDRTREYESTSGYHAGPRH